MAHDCILTTYQLDWLLRLIDNMFVTVKHEPQSKSDFETLIELHDMITEIIEDKIKLSRE